MGLFSHIGQDSEETERVLLAGRPNFDRCNNKVVTAKYSVWTFLPLATAEQFRRFANVYFLCIGVIMSLGMFTDYFATAMSPWTVLAPLAAVISVSLTVEGYADVKRHRSDDETNNALCTILRRADDIAKDGALRDNSIIGGKDVIVNLSKNYLSKSSMSLRLSMADDEQQSNTKPQIVKVAYQRIKRKDIRQGHIVLIRNRETVPADTIILASSGENGCAYIETSSIDGETNLKLRNSPAVLSMMSTTPKDTFQTGVSDKKGNDDERIFQSLERATKKITQLSALAYPEGISATTDFPDIDLERGGSKGRFSEAKIRLSRSWDKNLDTTNRTDEVVATLTSEPPNSHVNTFSGKLTLPLLENDGEIVEIPLDAENILLRGAILRNTEWVIGFSCFTGKDTKLIRNSFQTPSKFSRIDVLVNKCVVVIICFMCTCILYLSIRACIATENTFDDLWYIGFNRQSDMKWPYLSGDFPAPEWDNTSNNILQNFLMFVTLLSNFVPLSMLVTLEMVNFFCLWLINVDRDMYDPTTDTRALARSTNVTDLGQVQYIFSDKTGTLTQNVMRFKRCSVDGMIFGAPVQKIRPHNTADDNGPRSTFYPRRYLVVGDISSKPSKTTVEASKGMTFNAEMFIRVMSLCHTVVVEKDLDMNENIEESKSVSSYGSSWKNPVHAKKKFSMSRRGRTTSDMTATSSHGLETVSEEHGQKFELELDDKGLSRSSLGSIIRESGGNCSISTINKGEDGAPAGFAYQAESPDENALVSEASKTFGFQVVARNFSGITLRCDHPTILSDERIVHGLKNGSLSPKKLISTFATGDVKVKEEKAEERLKYTKSVRTETWEILAINKFDSERKRMSILLRSPPELGSIVILFCKGADSAMLEPNVCSGSHNLVSGNISDDEERSPSPENAVDDDESEWDTTQMLGLQSHLGEFASEGLRTLVLGVRFLTDKECNAWLELYKEASTALENRENMLKDAALAIEKSLHVVGVTAVEDKLQTGVPDTIATLEKAGIKLWVLTGDKRETAIEIGYSTKVLTPSMHLTQVSDQGDEFVRAQCAMEFMRLVKAGKLPLYQRAAVNQSDECLTVESINFAISKAFRSSWLFFGLIWLSVYLFVRRSLGLSTKVQERRLKRLIDEREYKKNLLGDIARRRNVRNRAEQIIEEFKRKNLPRSTNKPLMRSLSIGNLSLSNDDLPTVFNRASSARSLLEVLSNNEGQTSNSLRSVKLNELAAQEIAATNGQHIVDEDLLSLTSMCLGSLDVNATFDKKRRTVLERFFAVDRDVRKGRLKKHLRKGQDRFDLSITPSGEGPRALIIEGSALKHLLGDNELEELMFNIASQCDAVIACRVSPQQKALLVKLVRRHVSPEPVTLAIGDGANDVGMIQEAHVGIGISGREGRQAVNASDFSISQFRFLETLLLIHGRWDFMRQATTVLFSFYKNAVMAGCLIVYNDFTLYSGQSLFDQWVVSTFNFVASFPILFLGMFDRCLEKEYVRKNPIVYKSTRENEVLTMRVLFRWIFMTLSHILILFYGSFFYLSGGGGNTSSYLGLMRHHIDIGDGEGNDLQTVGLVIFSSMMILLAYKVLYESRSIINGKWPAIACWKGVTEGCWSRIPYTWYGILWGSLFFYFGFFLPIYNYITKSAEPSSGGFFNFNGVMPHALGTSSVNYISMLFVPIAGIGFDVCWKVFSNMYYPAQTQIHIELESKEFVQQRTASRGEREKRKHAATHSWRA